MRFHRIVCAFLAISLVLWCYSEYQKDHDVTEIMLRTFHETSDDILPSITICHKNPFGYHNVEDKINDDVTFQRYRMFIAGSTKDFDRIREEIGNDTEFNGLIDSLNALDYDEVTLNLNDLISEFNVQIPLHSENIDEITYDVVDNILRINRSSSHDELEDLEAFQTINAYVSFRHQNQKCFTFDIPMPSGGNIRKVQIMMNTSESTRGLNLAQYYFMLTYPEQILRASRGNKVYLNKHQKRSPQCYKFEVYVGSLEVFQRRNKVKEPCNAHWRRHDEVEFQNMIKKLGCNPKHWKIDPYNDTPFCTMVHQHEKMNKMLDRKEGFTQPCRSIEKISKFTKGTDPGYLCGITGPSYLDLRFYLDEEKVYKEIVLVPAYNFQNLVGNAGKSLLQRL